MMYKCMLKKEGRIALSIFRQYRGLRKELYILFWGRVVTNMGALIWPMMTLILTNKLGFTPGEASTIMLVAGAFMLPATLLGGKLADRLNKKYLIVVCDMVTVIGYMICGLVPLTKSSVVLLAIAGIFAQLEWPSFDALVAQLSTPQERERAYSLNYLGANLGLVLAPTLGGLLFENHLNIAFLISSLATFSSTVLIFFFVKDISSSRTDDASGVYENERNVSTREVLTETPVLKLFLVFISIVGGIYAVAMSFLLPLSMDHFFGSKGALFLGTLTSINAFTVIVGTPLLTDLMSRMRDITKIHLGSFLEILGCVGFSLAGSHLSVCYGSMVVFTLGEILDSLGNQPYITRRVPASHRGRVSSLRSVGQMLLQGVFLAAAGHSADFLPLFWIWAVLIAIGLANLLFMIRLRRQDRKQFALLYSE